MCNEMTLDELKQFKLADSDETCLKELRPDESIAAAIPA